MTPDQSRPWIYLQRITFGAVALLALIGSTCADVGLARWAAEHWDGYFGELIQRGNVMIALFLFLTLRAAYELDRMARGAGARPFTRFTYAMTAALMVVPWLSAGGWLGTRPVDVEGLYWQVVTLAVGVVGAGVCAMTRQDRAGTIRDVGTTILVFSYVGFLASFAVQLRCGRNVPDQEGAWLLLIILAVTKSADIGAYLVGTLAGRHKLIPSISPGKTVEGLFGGMMVAAGVSAWCAHYEVSILFARVGSVESAAGGSESAVFRAVVFGLIIALVGHFGDLIESCFKRDARAKDSGHWIPQYGGILDMVDSPIVTVAVGWFLLTTVWNVL